ncbi:MAG TPA: thiamine-phosphate kinase [Beijerinckiaceae bacterium]|nr:thiamine-phosphate kinase [Beijerinckiaceae bacterium]
MTRASPLSEDELIARFFAPLAGEGGLALKDDAALLRPREGHELVLTVDGVVAGVHFLPGDPAAAIAHKALAVNMSDLAAKGAEPAGFLLTLALPDDWTEPWLEAFRDGLGDASRAFACPLLGGDTVRSAGPFWISITALGHVPSGGMVRRTSARPGHRICVTGTIGDAALGLAVHRGSADAAILALPGPDKSYLIERYLYPRPRLAVAETLRRHAAAAMDISDGLAGDLAKMMRASGASAEVETACIPLSPAAGAAVAKNPALIDLLVTGGDDYEILCAVPEDRLAGFLAETAALGAPATVIGTVTAGDGLPVFRSPHGERRYERGAYQHF